MSKYVVECQCGNKLPVDVGQAGGSVTCSCGRSVDVPPLRQLRHLPAVEVIAAKRAARSWTVRHGLSTVCIIVLAVALGFIGWNRFTQPSLPKFDPTAYERGRDARIAKMTPTEVFEWWVGYYRPLSEHGLSQLENINRDRIEREIEHRHFVRAILWIIAGVAALILVATIFWPTKKGTGVISGSRK
jgi:hypothetical protein